MGQEVLVVTPVFSTPENDRLSMLLENIFWTQQQGPSVTHMIVDDGSTDQTPAVLEELAARHERLHFVSQSNAGSSAAINHGVDQALAKQAFDYITIIHSDDVLLPGAIDHRLRVLGNGSMVYTGMLIYNTNNEFIHNVEVPHFDSASDFYAALLRGCSFPNPTVMWSQSFFTDQVGGYDPAITSVEDWDIMLRSAAALEEKGLAFSSSDELTSLVRFHQHNIQTQNIKDGTRWRCYQKILSKHHEGAQYISAVAQKVPRHVRRKIAVYAPECVRSAVRAVRSALGSGMQPYERTSDVKEMISGVQYRRELGLQ